MPTWPATLPQSPDADGYTERPGYPVIQAPVDGPPLTRRRYTAAPKSYTVSFLLTDAQRAIFETFYIDEIDHGAIPYLWRERGIAANPLRLFGVADEPTVSYLGGIYWRLALRLVRLP